jgi:ribosomal protein S2
MLAELQSGVQQIKNNLGTQIKSNVTHDIPDCLVIINANKNSMAILEALITYSLL